jgi:succinate-semialdehyde dehydrogenase/glutarate-semialdehyde dehydrogenase
MVWINQWQAGGLDRTYEPAGNSGLGITGRTAAFDAATRQATVITGQP